MIGTRAKIAGRPACVHLPRSESWRYLHVVAGGSFSATQAVVPLYSSESERRRLMTGLLGGHGPDRPPRAAPPCRFQKVRIRFPLCPAIQCAIVVNNSLRCESKGLFVSQIRMAGERLPDASRHAWRFEFSRAMTFALLNVWFGLRSLGNS